MKHLLNSLLISLVIISVSSCDSSKKKDSNEVAKNKNEEKFDTRATEKEAEFVADAIAGGYAEIKLAELGSTKSSRKEVQEIAQTLVNDQTNAVTELQSLANQKGITVPVEEKEEAKEKVNDLASEKQPDFDKKWCDALVDSHEKIIRHYESMEEASEDPELKTLISKTLTDLRAGLDKLNSLEKNMI